MLTTLCAVLCAAVSGGTPAITQVIQQDKMPLPPVVNIVNGPGEEVGTPNGGTNVVISLPETTDQFPSFTLDPTFEVLSFEYTTGRRIVRAGAPDPWLGPTETYLRFVTIHELGHVFDDEVLTDAERATFKRIAHIPQSRGWDTPPNAPAERFAEAYRLCDLIGPTLPRDVVWRYIAYLWSPTPREQSLACKLIDNAAGLK